MRIPSDTAVPPPKTRANINSENPTHIPTPPRNYIRPQPVLARNGTAESHPRRAYEEGLPADGEHARVVDAAEGARAEARADEEGVWRGGWGAFRLGGRVWTMEGLFDAKREDV